jgi:hypothetical protein
VRCRVRTARDPPGTRAPRAASCTTAARASLRSALLDVKNDTDMV